MADHGAHKTVEDMQAKAEYLPPIVRGVFYTDRTSPLMYCCLSYREVGLPLQLHTYHFTSIYCIGKRRDVEQPRDCDTAVSHEIRCSRGLCFSCKMTAVAWVIDHATHVWQPCWPDCQFRQSVVRPSSATTRHRGGL